MELGTAGNKRNANRPCPATCIVRFVMMALIDFVSSLAVSTAAAPAGQEFSSLFGLCHI